MPATCRVRILRSGVLGARSVSERTLRWLTHLFNCHANSAAQWRSTISCSPRAQAIGNGARNSRIGRWPTRPDCRASRRVGVVTIPVVVHIVHNPASPAENISEAQIEGQIDVLNQDFRATNPDRVGVPSVWTHLIADCEIEFKLATTDPDGNPTNGITRTPTTKTAFFAARNDVKSSATGGADAWPSWDYLNMWVCGEILDASGDSILGYAQFPGGPPETDGVVIANPFFGTTGTARDPSI